MGAHTPFCNETPPPLTSTQTIPAPGMMIRKSISPNSPVQSLERPREWRTVQFWLPEADRSAANTRRSEATTDGSIKSGTILAMLFRSLADGSRQELVLPIL